MPRNGTKYRILNKKFDTNMFNYLCNFIVDDGKCCTESRRRIEILKYVFKKLNNVLREREISLETKQIVLSSYVMSSLQYGTEY